MVGAAPTAANARLRPRSAAAPRFHVAGSPERCELRRSGVLRALCALAAVLAVALWPAAAHARVDAGRAGTEQPRLWGIEIGTAREGVRPSHAPRSDEARRNQRRRSRPEATHAEGAQGDGEGRERGKAVGDRAHSARAREGHEKRQGRPRDLPRVPQARSNPVRREYGLALGRDRAVAQQRFSRPDGGRAPGRAGAGREAPRRLFVRLADPRVGQAEGAQICDL